MLLHMFVFTPDDEGPTWTVCEHCSIEQLTVLLYRQESNVFQMELTLVRSTLMVKRPFLPC